MLSKSMALGALGLALIGCGTMPAISVAQDVPNVLVFTEDSDKDTVPRDSRVQRNILDGINDRMIGRGYRMYDETALSIDGFRDMAVQDRVRRTDQELIKIANTIASPTIDVIVVYQVFASLQQEDFATFARVRIAGRLLAPGQGRRLGNFEVTTPDAYTLPVKCPRECLLENLAEEGRDLGIELADVLSDKLDQFFVSAAPANPVTESPGAGGTGFERNFRLQFSECSQRSLSDFEPYLVIFEGYIDHRADQCSSTRCNMTYISTINPGKLQRNLVKMLDHSGHPGRVNVSGTEYSVTCVPQRKRTPTDLNASDW